MNETIRVLLADDSPTARALIRAILRDAGGFHIVGEASDGNEALELTDRLAPDLILMDVHMPGLDGIAATREIMSRSPRPIVIVSAATARDVDLSLNATQAGALMALPKPEGPTSPRFDEQSAELVRMARAMASVKVVRRWSGGNRRPLVRPPLGKTGPGLTEIVAIAASTGGPPALRTILDSLPPDFPAPILIVQHIARDFSAGFAEWLGGSGRLRARLPEDGERLLAGTIYVAPDDRHLGVTRDGCVELSQDPPIGGFRPSATYLFASAGRVYGPRAMAVILTGMGSDGVDGLEAAHGAGTFVVAQDEATSVVFGMNGAAVQRGLADRVLPLERIAPIIMERVTGSAHES